MFQFSCVACLFVCSSFVANLFSKLCTPPAPQIDYLTAAPKDLLCISFTNCSNFASVKQAYIADCEAFASHRFIIPELSPQRSPGRHGFENEEVASTAACQLEDERNVAELMDKDSRMNPTGQREEVAGQVERNNLLGTPLAKCAETETVHAQRQVYATLVGVSVPLRRACRLEPQLARLAKVQWNSNA
jgi:hypothetical protein